jgi:hypothetical protein
MFGRFNKGRFAGAVVAVVVAAAPGAVWAHDFFLLPSDFSPDAGEASIQATIGSRFPQAETAVPAGRVRTLATSDGASVLAPQGVGPTGLNLRLYAQGEGLKVVGAALLPRDVEYAEERIPLIMEEYEVSPAAVRAVAVLPGPRTLRATSERFAKTLVCVRACADGAVATRPLGFALEFVAESGELRRFRLLSDGRPLADYPVAIGTADGGRLKARTDAQGGVTVPADARGPLMLFAATMDAPAAADGRFSMRLTSLTLEKE